MDDVFSIGAEGSALQTPTITTRTRYDVAKDIYDVLRGKGSLVAWASKHARWAATLRAAIQHTKRDTITKDQWISSISGALHTLGVEWLPGSHRGYITGRCITKLVGSEVSTATIVAGQQGSLKRAALEAAQAYEARSFAGHKRFKRRRIHFGSNIPFTEIPALIQEGFRRQREQKGPTGERVRSHYQAALHCLQNCLGDPRCDLMLMLVLTICSSSERLDVQEGDRHFSVSTKPNNPAVLAACLVTRMLWFLRPEAFPWQRDEAQVLRVPDMVKKIGTSGLEGVKRRGVTPANVLWMIEHIGNLRILEQVGWLRRVKGTRKTPRMNEVALQHDNILSQQRTGLMLLMKEPDRFIEAVLGCRDRIWVDRCSSVILEY